MSTATLREPLDTVFTDGDWFLDIAVCIGDEATPENVTAYDHYLTLRRRVLDQLAAPPEPIKLSTEDGSLLVTAPNLVGPRVRAPQLQGWDDGVYDFELSWTRPDGVTEVVLVGSLRVQTGLSLGGSFGALPIPATGPSLTVVRSPSQARVVRGTRGAAGLNGWTAVLATDDVTDPPRRLLKVIDWAGGGGVKPTVGAWVGAGGFVTDPDDASDFAGASTAAAIAAAALANGKAALADQKAALAADAAALANEKAGLADTAAGNADVKAALANEKAGLADTAAGNADAKAALANEKAGLADTAAGNANAKAALANEKAGLADTAAGTANAKAVLADQKATLAGEKAALADTAASAATLAVAAAIAALQGATGQATVSVTAPRYLTAADHGKLLAFVGNAPALLYVPAGLPAGFRAEVMKAGAADVFVVPVGLTAVNATAAKTGVATAYASELLRQVAADSYVVTNGDASAAPPSINFPHFGNAKASGLALAHFA